MSYPKQAWLTLFEDGYGEVDLTDPGPPGELFIHHEAVTELVNALSELVEGCMVQNFPSDDEDFSLIENANIILTKWKNHYKKSKKG